MAPMLELHNIDVQSFLSVLDTCEGDVFLVTRDGDHLNLKSKLCQLVGLTKLIEGGKSVMLTSSALSQKMKQDFSVLIFLVIWVVQRSLRIKKTKSDNFLTAYSTELS